MIAESASAVLSAWSNFYIMTGSSAAALTGLMFVVITLVTGVERARRSQDGISTFSTPTVLHFCAALMVSAVLSAPWRVLLHPAIVLALGGAYGIVYVARVMLATRQLHAYSADVEDWTWYVGLPFIAYGALFGGAIALPLAAVDALFALAGGVLLLLFIGIRNSWDVVTFLAMGSFGTQSEADGEPEKAAEREP